MSNRAGILDRTVIYNILQFTDIRNSNNVRTNQEIQVKDKTPKLVHPERNEKVAAVEQVLDCPQTGNLQHNYSGKLAVEQVLDCPQTGNLQRVPIHKRYK
jgi:tyrosine-protein phosphatase YwqE